MSIQPVCAASILLLLAASTAGSAERPNIVFFFVDDQTTSTLGCYGNRVVESPTIDGLAAHGVRFENAFVSQPICWVSRTSILTGLTGRSYGTPDDPELTRPDAAETLYSDLLRESGYRTGFIGKWHAKMPDGYKPQDHFDVFDSIFRNPFFKKQPDGSLRHETDLIVDRGIEFLEQQPADQPFALNLWLNACHAEDGDRRPGPHFAWPQSANGLYEGIDMQPPRLNDPTIFESLPDFFRTSITRERYFWRWNTETKYQTNMQAYLRMVSGIDAAIARFVEALEEAGQAENTIIVYSADNGYHMANRGLSGKWSHFEESIRVPLIIFDPRVAQAERGRVVENMALNLDLPSTFLDWAGVDIPDQYQGRSLQPIVASTASVDWRTETFHEHFAVRQRIPAWEGLRTERFKYARYFDHDYEFLHDLQEDPDELKNLAYDADYKDILHSMRERTARRVAELGGPLAALDGEFSPSTDPHPVSSAAVTVKPGSDGLVDLFNGRSLAGWAGETEYWSAADGVLTGQHDGSLRQNTFLSWKGSTIRNFDLRLEAKISDGGNSGVQYRGMPLPEIGLEVVKGYQCDIVAGNPEYNGMLYEERGRGILARVGQRVIVAPDGRAWVVGQFDVPELASDEWHEYRVEVKGNRHRHWIDGQLMVEVIDFDEEHRAEDGVLALQLHRGPAMQVQFREIRIEHLPDDLPLLKFEEHPIPAGSLGVRPSGALPAGWQPPVYEEEE